MCRRIVLIVAAVVWHAELAKSVRWAYVLLMWNRAFFVDGLCTNLSYDPANRGVAVRFALLMRRVVGSNPRVLRAQFCGRPVQLGRRSAVWVLKTSNVGAGWGRFDSLRVWQHV